MGGCATLLIQLLVGSQTFVMTNPEFLTSEALVTRALIVPRLNWRLNFLKVSLWPKVNKSQTKSPRNPKRTHRLLKQLL